MKRSGAFSPTEGESSPRSVRRWGLITKDSKTGSASIYPTPCTLVHTLGTFRPSEGRNAFPHL